MNPEIKSGDASTKMYRVSKIELDDNGALPTRIMLMQTGNWPTSVKGNFAISLDDLKQIKDNFDKGIGFPTDDASTGLAIDFMHNYHAEAGAWIKGLELEADDDNKTGKLFATPIEWTDAGSKAVLSGEFKMISPSGYFGKRNGKATIWANPTNLKEKVANVLDGAGLTNIPFLRGMSPIRASAQTDNDLELEYDKVIFISDIQQKKGESMTIDELRVKDKDQLTAEELTFVTEHKSELSADELKKFELTVEAEEDKKDQLSTEDKELLAAIKSGTKKVVDAAQEEITPERLSALEGTAKKYETEKAEAVVEAHVKRGALKQDAASNWTERLLASTGDARIALEADLKALPDNPLVSKEVGSGEDTNAGSTAREQLDAIATKKVADAAKEGKTLLYGDALKEALAENEDLGTQDAQDVKEKVGV